MFARIITLYTADPSSHWEPELFHRLTVRAQEVMPKMAGFVGGYGLMDRKSGKAILITLWESEEALGLMSKMSYEQREAPLGEVDSVLFYSDGLVEAHDAKGEMFGFPRLRALLAEHAEERPLGEFLMEELYSFVGEIWEQEDDITLLTLERSPIRT